jgi:hypothetical protein
MPQENSKLFGRNAGPKLTLTIAIKSERSEAIPQKRAMNFWIAFFPPLASRCER